MAETITCTECGSKLKVAALPAPGKKIRCPKCQESFTPARPNDDDEREEEEERRPAKSVRRRDDDDDDDDRDEAPRRRGGMRARPEFEFDGAAGDFFVVALLSYLLALVTFGIGTPWAICMIEKWKAEHTLINERRLRFDGNGGEFFVVFIINYLLILITFGIYSFWAVPKIMRWVIEHYHFAD